MDAAEPRPAIIVPARDGDIAIQEELDNARKQGAIAAYDLFIERHPGHPLIAKAEEERNRLLKTKK